MKKSGYQQGQALVFSLLLIVVLSVVGLCLIRISETAQRESLEQNALRHQALSKSMQAANILNEISINNRLIVISLLQAVRGWKDALDSILLLQITTPYWEGDQVPSDVPKAQEVFDAFSRRTGRAFVIARALTRKNEALLLRLRSEGHLIGPLLRQSSASAAACFAAKVAEDAPAGTPLAKVVREIGFGGASFGRCGVFSGSERLIHFGSEFAFMREQQNKIGVILPKQGVSNRFAESMLGEPVNTPKMEATHLKVIRNLTNETGGGSQAVFQASVIHPKMRIHDRCGSGKEGGAGFVSSGISPQTLLMLEDFRQARMCGLNEELLASAFFSPHWSAAIVGGTDEKSL